MHKYSPPGEKSNRQKLVFVSETGCVRLVGFNSSFFAYSSWSWFLPGNIAQDFILCYITSYNFPIKYCSPAGAITVVSRRFICPSRQAADWHPGKMTDYHAHELIFIFRYKTISQVGNKAV